MFTGNSLERIRQYLLIEHEPMPSEEGVPPAYWPASGRLEVQDLSARYSIDGPEVLHGLSFAVNSGERVGIVGRTGSGKVSHQDHLLVLYPNNSTEFVNTGATALYPDGRESHLRRHKYRQSQRRCPTIEYHYHSTSSKPFFSIWLSLIR